MPEEEVGKVTHYFPKVSVAVVELSAPLRTGEVVRIAGHAGSFTQEVSEMQVDHAGVSEAKPGQSIGLKVAQHAHEGNKVFRLSKEDAAV